jgi:signal transduction histidine kinase
VIALARRELESRQVEVQLKTDRGCLLVNAAGAELQQVIMNLVMNAAQAMRDTPPSGRTVVLQATRKGDSALVTVRDHGCGVPEHHLPNIFEPFITTKSAGLGMGLSICRRLIDKHGGRISARNNPDGGATFEFTLPVHQPQA